MEREIARSLYSVMWGGPDSDEIRHEWSVRHAPAMHAAAAALNHSASRLIRNAEAQARTSAVDNQGSSLTGFDPATLGLAFAPVGSHAGDEAPSWLWDVLKEQFPQLVDLYLTADQLDVLPRGLQMSGAAMAALGGSFGLFSVAMGGMDLFAEQQYQGRFATVESVGDVLQIASGVTGLVAAVAAVIPGGQPVAGAVGAVSLGLGLTSLAVESGLEFWDEGGGREAWYSAAAWATDTWETVSVEVDARWDSTYESASDAVEQGVEAVEDGVDAVVGAVEGTWRRATGWL
jgi:hypothetical protein